MKLDIHCHVVGRGNADITRVDEEVFFNPDDNQHAFVWLVHLIAEQGLMSMGADLDENGTVSTDEYMELIYKMVTTSEELDGVVLLALDAVYDEETRQIDPIRTDLWVSNRFLSRKAVALNERIQRETDPQKRSKRIFYGASVSPNRRDWERELQFVVDDPLAVLMKLIPSTQHIALRDERHRAYFTALAETGIPLLCHVGPEYSFPEGVREMRRDNFRFLDAPLSCGTRVIAAHCATPVFPPFEKNEIEEVRRLMAFHNSGATVQFWADSSALSLGTRIPIIRDVLDHIPPQWLLHGSDFPIPVDGWKLLRMVRPNLSLDEYQNVFQSIRKTSNSLDRDVRLKRAYGFSDSILENAEKVLRLPEI
jgi:predicted TIM-barrel fold metal-dependent hydrolase